MNVVVGSQNKDKIRILKKTLEEVCLKAEVIGMEVDSGIIR